MQLGLVVAYFVLFGLVYMILLAGYRRNKLSLRRFGILQAALIVAFPIVASAASLTFAGGQVAPVAAIFGSFALAIGAAIGTWAGLRWLDPRGVGSAH